MYTSHIHEGEIRYLQSALLAWYEQYGRVFPWRADQLGEYELVIAETLLQRTKAETVAKYYQSFIRAFPSWESLSRADTTTLGEYLRPLGLFSQRTKRLQALANEMVRRNGVLPRDRGELESIPFFGQYIANAIELVIFNLPSPLLDVNMARVLERYFGPRALADIRYDPYLQQLAYRVADHPRARDVNWAILDFAARICQAQKPRCLNCLVNENCAYFHAHTPTVPINGT
jgi:A/G-specific adenine glycosylase